MNSVLIIAAGSLLAAALPAAALAPQRQSQPHPPPTPSHTLAPHMTPAAPPSQKMAPRPPAATPMRPPAHEGTGPRPYQAEAGAMHGEMRGEMRYGRWEEGWGPRPPAPPHHFTRHEDWYRHVRACQQRYKSYNPRTDMYMARPGHARRCTL